VRRGLDWWWCATLDAVIAGQRIAVKTETMANPLAIRDVRVARQLNRVACSSRKGTGVAHLTKHDCNGIATKLNRPRKRLDYRTLEECDAP
jgi:hypothetical protein